MTDNKLCDDVDVNRHCDFYLLRYTNTLTYLLTYLKEGI